MMILSHPYCSATVAVLLGMATIAAAERVSPVVPDRGRLAFDSIPEATFRFHDPLGQRVQSNVDQWLLIAPDANPGMLEMFRQRDRNPRSQLVPWAGEFVGKYLISSIQARRMTDEQRLHAYTSDVIDRLLATQAKDGYLGPFPADERLLGHWDLWGHYHAMLALLMWYEETGDQRALRSAEQAGQLVCHTYLDSGRRVLDAGSHEMNMAIVHVLGKLYRMTGSESFLRMMREIEKDWEKAGDYVRTGLAGRPFHQTPRPRWESLHDLQGLVEFYRITGDTKYRQAFTRHWMSIVQHDRHPSGGFTTGERAVGNPYQEGAIETCCTTAWTAMTVDMLRLTGDVRAADELELSFWNSVLGSQHPSGRWWSYNTPINGVREASAHTIVFQARHGTPELNCCSVNGPRGLGALSDWAVMRDATGVAVNFYGPGEIRLQLEDGTPVRLKQETDFPAGGKVALTVHIEETQRFNLRLRIPGWSRETQIALNGRPWPSAAAKTPSAGVYVALDREWHDGDLIELQFDMTPRHWSGAMSRSGRAAIYVGPLLLAFDPYFNSIDSDAIPPMDLSELKLERITERATSGPGAYAPLGLWKTIASGNTPLTLCDFATAGAHGTDYVAWLPANQGAPPPVRLSRPLVGERVAAGPVLFVWTSLHGAKPAADHRYTLRISEDAAGKELVYEQDDLLEEWCVVSEPWVAGRRYYYQVLAHNGYGARANELGPRAFFIDSDRPNTVEQELQLYRPGPDLLIASSALDGNGRPTYGVLAEARGCQADDDRFGRKGGAISLSGNGSGVWYRLARFPSRDYTFCVWVCPGQLPTDRLQQVFSAWCAGLDDPLRVVFHGHQLFARIEAGKVYSTAGVPVESKRWMHVAAVKQAERLTLFVDGAQVAAVAVPERISTAATGFAIGANPHYTGANECLQGSMDDFVFFGRAFTSAEVAEVFRRR